MISEYILIKVGIKHRMLKFARYFCIVLALAPKVLASGAEKNQQVRDVLKFASECRSGFADGGEQKARELLKGLSVRLLPLVGTDESIVSLALGDIHFLSFQIGLEYMDLGRLASPTLVKAVMTWGDVFLGKLFSEEHSLSLDYRILSKMVDLIQSGNRIIGKDAALILQDVAVASGSTFSTREIESASQFSQRVYASMLFRIYEYVFFHLEGAQKDELLDRLEKIAFTSMISDNPSEFFFGSLKNILKLALLRSAKAYGEGMNRSSSVEAILTIVNSSRYSRVAKIDVVRVIGEFVGEVEFLNDRVKWKHFEFRLSNRPDYKMYYWIDFAAILYRVALKAVVRDDLALFKQYARGPVDNVFVDLLNGNAELSTSLSNLVQTILSKLDLTSSQFDRVLSALPL